MRTRNLVDLTDTMKELVDEYRAAMFAGQHNWRLGYSSKGDERYLPIDWATRRVTRICSVRDCNSFHYAKGYCQNHYNKFRKQIKRAAR